MRRARAGARGRAAVGAGCERAGRRGRRRAAAQRRAADPAGAVPARARAPAARAAQPRPHLARGDRRARVRHTLLSEYTYILRLCRGIANKGKHIYKMYSHGSVASVHCGLQILVAK